MSGQMVAGIVSCVSAGNETSERRVRRKKGRMRGREKERERGVGLKNVVHGANFDRLVGK